MEEREARAKIARLGEAGIRAFVDLTEEGELRPYERLLPRDATYIRVPVPDVTCPERAQVEQALDAIDLGLTSGGVYVHCRGGCGRTGVILGAYLVRHGETPA